MPSIRLPGVYIREIPASQRPIVGVGTDKLGMAGESERGPLQIRAVTSYAEYHRLYGDPLPDRYLGHAVQGFFDNGGRGCFVARVASRTATTAMLDTGPLRITAIGPGVSGNNIWVWVTDSNAADPQRFRIVVAYYRDGVAAAAPLDPTSAANRSLPGFEAPTEFEDFDSLGFTGNDAAVTLTALARSILIRAEWHGTPGRPGNTGPAALAGALSGNPADIHDYIGGDRAVAGIGGPVTTGYEGLATVDEIALLAAPDEHAVPGLREHLQKQCTRAGDRFGIFSVAGGQRDAAAISEPHPPSTMGAVYWPWIQVRHPSDNTMITIPPVGHVAGIFAHTDTTRGVHKAPANVVVQGALDLEFSVTAEDQDLLNPRGVNVVRDFRGSNRGIRLWGARTMSSDPEWKYVSVRRLAIYLRESIDKGTRWAVFEPNAPALWESIGKSIENFLHSVWRDGALQGAQPEQAFFVRCDHTTMTQDDIDSGRLICEIGIAPVKPAEFVILGIRQKTADSR